mmetsp:Transcript_30562/g.99812  ORF Transcript_30562/g.99812 Transcript_30562/m.99812 type:complete len:721 (-) Transcript_30562:166-2328(-)
MSSPASTRSRYVAHAGIPVAKLDCRTAFDALTPEEKLYAHHLSRASFEGSLAVLFQVSVESPYLFALFQHVFHAQRPADLRAAWREAGVSDAQADAFVTFAAAVYSNCGNYRAFGDTKILPDLDEADFVRLVKLSAAYAADSSTMDSLLAGAAPAFSDAPRSLQLGLGADNGVSTYFSANCTTEDAELAQRFLDANGISAYNTRLFKTVAEDGKVEYEVRVAAAEEGTLRTLEFEGTRFVVRAGDHAPFMAGACAHLEAAAKTAANDMQRSMLAKYAESFRTGSIDAHKDGSRFWIKDKGPVVESYIGFIESYRDPFGTRGEWEGFVAVVNKEMSKKFETLVARAEELLPLLPWPASYEKDHFLKPDFTSLDVVSFAGSGIPAGINIPNYDDVRQEEGFKNVSLGNVLSARSMKDRVTFLLQRDQEPFRTLLGPAFEVQVGLHELLGHGSGKLFCEAPDGRRNFAPDTPDLEAEAEGAVVSSWYKPGETWDSKFPGIGSSYEECRAECVGVFLCVSREVLSIFGHEGAAAEEIAYINWLNMARSGLVGLEFYTPERRLWGQAHMRARFVILRVLLEAGEGFVTLEREDAELPEGEAGEGLYVRLDRSKIESVGVPAIASFLRKLQVFKSTANFAAGQELYERYSAVDEYWLGLREVVMANKKPRQMFVQSNTRVGADGAVELLEYEPSADGVVESFVDRFPADTTELVALAKAEAGHHLA